MITVLGITDKPPVTFTTEMMTEAEVHPNETLHTLLKGHIAILQNELETLEKVIK